MAGNDVDAAAAAKFLAQHPELVSELRAAVSVAVREVVAGRDVSGRATAADLDAFANAIATARVAVAISGRTDLAGELDRQTAALEYIHRIQLGRQMRAALLTALDVVVRVIVPILLKVA